MLKLYTFAMLHKFLLMSSRKIAQQCPPSAMGPLSRIIGSVDIDGKGHNHPLEQVDPFMLLDQATIPESDLPKFGAHPHRGHSVVTLVVNGQVKSWDSFSNKLSTVKAPASYWVDAGSGIFHDEVTVVPNAEDPNDHCSMFQLWVTVKEEDRSKLPSAQYCEKLPVADAKNEKDEIIGKIIYYVGSEYGVSIQTPHPIIAAQVEQQPNTSLKFPIDPKYGGFIVNMKGAAITVAGTTTSKQKNDILVFADTASDKENCVEITTAADAVTYLVCTGEKINEPWYKKLAANGAIIAKTPEEAREIAQKVETYSEEGKASGNFAPFGAVLSPKS